MASIAATAGAPPAPYVPPGRRGAAVRLARLSSAYLPLLKRHPEIFSGSQRKKRGPAWSAGKLRKQLELADGDLETLDAGGKPSGHFWVALRGNAAVAVVGFYWQKEVFVHALHAPGASEKGGPSASERAQIINLSVAELARLEPDQQCVIAQCPNAEAYAGTGFVCVSQTLLARLPREGSRKKPGSGRAMALMVCTLPPRRLRRQSLARKAGAPSLRGEMAGC